MTASLMQLAAIGIQDLFLTREPQITFFKIVYRRHTNFSIEAIPQYFIHKPNFGKRVTCTISRQGDLIGPMWLVVQLPKIKEFATSSFITAAWARKIGYALIKSIEIEIGGQVIDKQCGEWLNIWTELTQSPSTQYDKMIGNIPELFEYTNGKDEYTIYIPLQFWFCKSYGQAIPLVCLQYSDVKVIIEINEIENCLSLAPTHYIIIDDDVVNFEQYEYIKQDLPNNSSIIGRFCSFDVLTKRMYYLKITKSKFVSTHPITGTKYKVIPISNTLSHTTPRMNYSLNSCYLLVNYFYLDTVERNKFLKSEHKYLIEQITALTEHTIESTNRTVTVNLDHPCKFMTWVVQLNYLSDKNVNDYYNYTDSPVYSNNKLIGKSIIKNQTVLLNGHERLSYRPAEYFNWIQSYQHFRCAPSEGVNVYSFSLLPMMWEPSGTCNMSKMEKIEVKLNLNHLISTIQSVKFRGYAVTYNVLQITNGLGGLSFVR